MRGVVTLRHEGDLPQSRERAVDRIPNRRNNRRIVSYLEHPREGSMPQHAVDSTLKTIGNTPVVKLNRVVPADCADIYIKLEGGNPTGSYKDRLALAMIEGAEQRGELTPGRTVVEYTGGST